MLILAFLVCLFYGQFALASNAELPNATFENEIKQGWKCQKPLDAIAHYDKAIEIDPGKAVAYQSRGERYKDLHQYQKALKDYGQAIYLSPLDARMLADRASVYEEMHQNSKAMEDLNQAIKLDPKNSGYWSYRAMLRMKLGQDKDAIADFSKAIQYNPKPTYNDLCQRARLYKRSGKRNLALKDLALSCQAPANGTIGPQNMTNVPPPPVLEPFKDEDGKTYADPSGGLLSKQLIEQEYNALNVKKVGSFYDFSKLPKLDERLK